MHGRHLRRRVLWVLLLLLALFPSSQARAWEIDATDTVDWVIDGDTFVGVSLDRVRLADVDTPELGEPGADAAKAYLEDLLLGEQVHLDIDDVYGTDIYGRWVAVVYVRHNVTYLLNVNDALLRSDLAVITDFPNEFTPDAWSLFVYYPDPDAPDTTPPVLTVPSGDLITEATSSEGAVVFYTATAVDDVDGAIPPFCSPSSGSRFSLGATTVTCSAEDSHGNEATASFHVVVQDTTPPALTLPTDLAVEATSANGTVVTFTVEGYDLVDGPVAVECSPASGSLFPIGSTTVRCTAVDATGNSASASFTVAVEPPARPRGEAFPLLAVILLVAAITTAVGAGVYLAPRWRRR